MSACRAAPVSGSWRTSETLPHFKQFLWLAEHFTASGQHENVCLGMLSCASLFSPFQPNTSSERAFVFGEFYCRAFTDWKERMCVRSNLFVVSVREKEHLMFKAGRCFTLWVWLRRVNVVVVCCAEKCVYVCDEAVVIRCRAI